MWGPDFIDVIGKDPDSPISKIQESRNRKHIYSKFVIYNL